MYYDKHEVILAQIQACEKLLKDTKDEVAHLVIKNEIVDLTLVLAAIKRNKNSKLIYCSSYGCKNKAITLCSTCFDFYSCSYNHACLHRHSADEFQVLQ